ncbi:hypothetical protein Tco_0810876 [Tanacetum coccineum]
MAEQDTPLPTITTLKIPIITYRKRLLQVIKIHTDHNVANLLIKAFDVSRCLILRAWIKRSAADNTHRSFVWGKAVWNYVYKYSRLYIMDVSNKGAKSASDENRFNSGLELKDKKELAIPGQTTTGKEFSNPLMAGSLPKILLLQKLVMLRISSDSGLPLYMFDQLCSHLRTDLLFDDEDGITFLTNDDIFENLALMGSKIVLEKPNEPPLTEGHTSGSKDGSMKHTFELMDTVPPTISYFTLSHVRLPTPGVMSEDASKKGRKVIRLRPMFKDSDFDDLDDLVDEGNGFCSRVKIVLNQGSGIAAQGLLLTTTVFDVEGCYYGYGCRLE